MARGSFRIAAVVRACLRLRLCHSKLCIRFCFSLLNSPCVVILVSRQRCAASEGFLTICKRALIWSLARMYASMASQ